MLIIKNFLQIYYKFSFVPVKTYTVIHYAYIYMYIIVFFKVIFSAIACKMFYSEFHSTNNHYVMQALANAIRIQWNLC